MKFLGAAAPNNSLDIILHLYGYFLFFSNVYGSLRPWGYEERPICDPVCPGIKRGRHVVHVRN